MVQDARWPSKILITLRGVQLFLAIIVLGLSAYIVSVIDYWWACMTLVSALLTLIYIGINFFLLFSNLLLPLAITITDAFLAVFWLISMAGTGDSGYLSVSDCELTDWYWLITYTSTVCQVSKASFALSFLLMLLFIGSLVLAAIILAKNRKDLRGAKYNSGMDPDGNPLPDHAAAAPAVPDAVAMDSAPNQTQYYQDPPKNEHYQQSLTPQPYQNTTSPVYYNATATPQPIASPSATPAPYSQVVGYPQAGVGSPPPPPPVNAAEMPTR
ncbi:unnamed protein product [Tuber melanosporum]|jgi:hypothetical protein|uniref:(Perigord truffle) hypothetical protein n=1 Tax=Tuber melanosporum (strain Mel28) TaxID=656061 RepID=D5G8Z9_TUBMM|nr:uncharacterized protein GSTUM_00004913001 [Tuber melanosporum]CAZ80992.1 unnamed protein product [Tuber melanosporum]